MLEIQGQEIIEPIGDVDTQQDKLIDKIISNTHKHLGAMLQVINKEVVKVPAELDYIIEEIAVRRYNRIGSEGFKSENVEGHSITFYGLDEEFSPYLTILNGYAPDDKAEQLMGKVRLF